MNRSRTWLAAAALATVAAIGVAAPASAQDYPGTTPTTVGSCPLSVSFNAPALPNATVNVTFGCNLIESGNTYTGSLASTPVALPNTTATADDTITFVGVKLPADWEVNATHSGTLVDLTANRTLGTATFFVDKSGRISAPPKGGIPRTGSDYVEPGLQIGAALLAAGTLALVVSRRRRRAAATLAA